MSGVVDPESDSQKHRVCHSCVSPGGGKSSEAGAAAGQPPKLTGPESKGKSKSAAGATSGLKLSAAAFYLRENYFKLKYEKTGYMRNISGRRTLSYIVPGSHYCCTKYTATQCRGTRQPQVTTINTRTGIWYACRQLETSCELAYFFLRLKYQPERPIRALPSDCLQGPADSSQLEEVKMYTQHNSQDRSLHTLSYVS